MTHTIMTVPVAEKVGLTMVTCGIIDAIQSESIAVDYFKPVALDVNDAKESLATVKSLFDFSPQEPLLLQEVLELLGNERESEILEKVANKFCETGIMQKSEDSPHITVIQGINYDSQYASYVAFLNRVVAQAFSAKIIIVVSQTSDPEQLLMKNIEALTYVYHNKLGLEVLGYVINGAYKERKHVIDRCRERKLGSIDTFVKLSKKISYVKKHVTKYISKAWIAEVVNSPSCTFLSPPFFLHSIVERAQKLNKRIVLPEGSEVRTLRAASICHERKIAQCVLLGDKDEIKQICWKNQIKLPKDIEIIEPAEVAEKYVDSMFVLRQHKGLTKAAARKLLHNNEIVLGTMMLEQGDVDGMVSGAVHLTSDTVRPALQLIKTSKDQRIVSSSFFMCLLGGTVLYADCAVNRNPSIEDLADIAIQSADTAALFGFEPRIGLLSFSTEKSGSGEDVSNIEKAVKLVHKKRPKLQIEGPLQYDAASDPFVAKLKAPDSEIAGKVNVYIFPNLNTSNIVYKAVQRTNNIICIGPVLQGLKKPVNDLSRGASPEDIVYTIAVTAIQSNEVED